MVRGGRSSPARAAAKTAAFSTWRVRARRVVLRLAPPTTPRWSSIGTARSGRSSRAPTGAVHRSTARCSWWCARARRTALPLAAPRGSGAAHTLTERWNGTKWAIVASPNRSPAGVYSSTLQDVSCSGARSCFAVGLSIYTEPHSSAGGILTQQWNGTKWFAIGAPTCRARRAASSGAFVLERAGLLRRRQLVDHPYSGHGTADRAIPLSVASLTFEIVEC